MGILGIRMLILWFLRADFRVGKGEVGLCREESRTFLAPNPGFGIAKP